MHAVLAPEEALARLHAAGDVSPENALYILVGPTGEVTRELLQVAYGDKFPSTLLAGCSYLRICRISDRSFYGLILD